MMTNPRNVKQPTRFAFKDITVVRPQYSKDYGTPGTGTKVLINSTGVGNA